MIIETRNRVGAVSMADQRMEIIRNLDYSTIGTKTPNGSGGYDYGIPSGDILQDETVSSGNQSYRIHTVVQYVDDPFDGKVTGTTPVDTVPNDYKKVNISVEWGDGDASHGIDFSSVFVPKGVEQSAGGGVLSINVIDTSGVGIGDADVRITNTTTSPHIDVTAQTDSSGNLTFVSAPAASQSYAISVSKAGYFPVTTYPGYPTSAFMPIETHASVVVGALNQTTLVTDRTANLTMLTKDPFGAMVPNRMFHIAGGKQIGTIPGSTKQYVFSQDVNSGTNGSSIFSGNSAGTYTVTLVDDSSYAFLRLSSDETDRKTVTLLPGNDRDVTMTFISKTLPSLLVKAETIDTPPVAIPGAAVHLTDPLIGYDATVTADRYGQAYFPIATPALTAGNYTASVTAAGYQATDTSIIIGSGLKTQEVKLPVQ